MARKRGKKQYLDQINMRGDRDKWIDFTYHVRKRKEKNIWTVLERFIDKYIKEKN